MSVLYNYAYTVVQNALPYHEDVPTRTVRIKLFIKLFFYLTGRYYSKVLSN